MMREEFESIDDIEYEKLKRAIALITVLIAGADGLIDKKETSWAKKITDIRVYNHPTRLNGFYEDVGKNFAVTLDHITDTYPVDLNERQAKISSELSELNDILSKINNTQGAVLYQSFRTFAKHVAKASGGIWGFFSIDSDEKRWMKLDMINQIIAEDPEGIL